jgi:hypothetical protein
MFSSEAGFFLGFGRDRRCLRGIAPARATVS